MRWRVFRVVVIVVATVQLALHADFHKPTGAINDFANIVDEATRTELDALVRKVEDEMKTTSVGAERF